ncbi:hypothetical protein FACS189425_03930 [Clostridia bacterium]|nr:hypothetical protein FACS189425_03930 [Clostridia bacterium]
MKKIDPQLLQMQRTSEEILWSNIFHDTIINSTWFKDKTVSPGRWAVGYPFLYVLYRVLNEVKPKSILELGVGQSTRMTAQYSNTSGCKHVAVDHDPEWLDFFKKQCDFLKNVRLETLPLLKKDCFIYEGFEKVICNKQFDLIIIDAPYGFQAKPNSPARIDVLPFIPECLTENFVILLDDFNRTGEQEMLKLLLSKLGSNSVQYQTGIYSGQKDTMLVSGGSLGFLCTM